MGLYAIDIILYIHRFLKFASNSLSYYSLLAVDIIVSNGFVEITEDIKNKDDVEKPTKEYKLAAFAIFQDC